MDKNKSAPKLKDIPHIYWINLDGKEDRRIRTEQMLSYWEVANTRISAYDGRDDDLSDIVYGKYPDNMTSGEIGCVTSHLKAIQYWMENSDDEYAIMMEDDCDMDSVKHWPFTWKEWFRWAPAAWDILQIAVINPAIPVMQCAPVRPARAKLERDLTSFRKEFGKTAVPQRRAGAEAKELSLV